MNKKNRLDFAVGNTVCGVSNDKDIIVDQDMYRAEILNIEDDILEIRVDRHKYDMFRGATFKVPFECVMKIGDGDSFREGDIVCFTNNPTEYEIISLGFGNYQFLNCETGEIRTLDYGDISTITHSKNFRIGDYVRAGHKADMEYCITTSSNMDYGQVINSREYDDLETIIRIDAFKDGEMVGTYPVGKNLFIKISKKAVDKL